MSDELTSIRAKLSACEWALEICAKERDDALLSNRLLLARIDDVTKERDAIRAAFAEASHLAGPAFVAHEELARLRAENEALKAAAVEYGKTALIAAESIAELSASLEAATMGMEP